MPSQLEKSDIISFGALVALLTWLTFRPVEIPCINCDIGGMFFKCAPGTGAGSVTCDAYMSGKKAVEAGTRAATTMSEYTKDLTLFASKIPEYLAEFATVLKVKLLQVSADVYRKLQSVWVIVKQKLEEVRALLSKPIHDAWNTVFDQVIQPMITAIIKYILEPVTKLIDSVAAFVGIVLKEVKGVIGESQDIVAKAYDATYAASGQVSATVERIIKDCAELIEKLVTSIRTTTNDTLDTVMGGLETSVNNIGKGVNAAIDGLETGVNKVLSGAVGTASNAVNDVGAAIDTIATGTADLVNDSLGKVTGGLQGAINTVSDDIESAVNTVGAGVVDGASGIVHETEDIINDLSTGLETSVNTLINVINTNVSGTIEATANGSAGIIEDAVNTLLKPIQSITTGINKIPAVKLSLGALGNIYPFSFVPTVRPPNNVDFPTLDIPDIDPVDIPSVHLPSFKYVTRAQQAKAAAKAQGRQRILGAIARAQKNWKMARSGTIEDQVYYVRRTRNYAFMPANCPEYEEETEEDEIDDLMDQWSSQGQRPLGKSIFNKIGDGFKKAANTVAKGTVSVAKTVAKGTVSAANTVAKGTVSAANTVAKGTVSVANTVAKGTVSAAHTVADFAEDTADKAVDGLEDLAVAAMKPLVKSIQDAQAGAARDAVERSAKASADAIAAEKAAADALTAHATHSAAVKTQVAAKKKAAAEKANATNAKYAAAPNVKTVSGVSIPPVSITAPTISVKAPGLRVSLKAPEVKIDRPDMQVKLPRPHVDIKIGDISAEVPKIPNLFDGVEAATRKLRELLSSFFEPVWGAMGTLFAFVNTVIVSVIHFFKNELSWSKIKNGVFTVIADASVSVADKLRWFRDEVAVPLYQVMLVLKDKLVEFARYFVKATMGLLVNLKEKLYALVETIWVKVKPVLKEAAVVSGGIGMLAIGRLVDKLIPLPMTVTTKVYAFLTLLATGIIYYVLTQAKFVTDRLGELAKVCMVPFMFADEAFENFVKSSKAPMAATLRTAFGV
ncbi:hypothetical protein JKP88DRAFT_241048 [Tribonema minus]|uniref:Uncharacterized protein n=1 Tax=Tribonema minus TaxID=303371 RepID=A0A835Z7M2_9STRA|nr:hypothetical protein JKP88DRAFT_241048 [Tribonema minus]